MYSSPVIGRVAGGVPAVPGVSAGRSCWSVTEEPFFVGGVGCWRSRTCRTGRSGRGAAGVRGEGRGGGRGGEPAELRAVGRGRPGGAGRRGGPPPGAAAREEERGGPPRPPGRGPAAG